MSEENQPPRKELVLQGSNLADIVKEAAPLSFQRMKPAERQRLKSFQLTSTTVHAEASFYRGPMPPAELLIGYNKALPDGADRLVKMAENQSAHRMRQEEKAITSQLRQSERGQLFAFVIGMTVIIGGFVLIALGKTVEGSIFSGTGLATLVGLFVYGRSTMKKNLKDKAPPEANDNAEPKPKE